MGYKTEAIGNFASPERFRRLFDIGDESYVYRVARVEFRNLGLKDPHDLPGTSEPWLVIDGSDYVNLLNSMHSLQSFVDSGPSFQ